MAYKPSNPNGQNTMANSEPVVIASNQSAIPVSGTFWQTTQPISIASMPSTPVTGTFWQTTQPVSLASVPSHAVTNVGTFAVQASQSGAWNITNVSGTVSLPTGAATSALQTSGNSSLTTLAAVDFATGTDVASLAVVGPGAEATAQRVTLSTESLAALETISIGGSVAVTGTFWQTTQPVSISSMPSTPVTGTFWQTTQPVSLTSTTITGSVAVTGPLTDTQIRATALPVSLASVPSHAVTLTSTTITGSVAVTDNAGSLTVDAPVATPVYVRLSDGAAAITTLPVSIASMPSTPVTGTFWQTTQPVSLASVPSHAVTNVGTFAVQVTSAPSTPVTGTFWQATQPVSGTVTANISGSISNTSFAATQNTASSLLNKPYGAVTTAAPTYTTATDNALSLTTAGALRIDGSGVTQPVSIASMPSTPVTGTFWQTTQPVSLASVPSHPVTLASTTITGSVAVTGSFWQATQPVSGPLTDTQLRATAVPVSGTVTANAGSGNFTVTQATASNLNATVTGTVELGATSLAALENISVTIPGTVDLGTVSLTALETITVTSATASNFLNKPYGSVTTAAPAYTTGTDNALSLTTSGALRVDSSATTQPVSIASMPSTPVTGTFWQTTQPVSLASVPTHAVTLTSTTITGSVAVTGPLTDTQIRATALPVSIASMPSTPVTGTFWQTTQPVSGTVEIGATSLAALETTNAVQSGTWNIGSITTLPSLATGANVIGAVTQSGAWTVTTAAADTHDGAAGTIGQMQVGYASSTAQTAVQAGDAARLWTTLNGALNIADAGGSITVDGTFWQATQPVSLASVPTHAVTLTSTTITGSVAVTGPLTDTQLRATALPVSIASMPSTPVTGTFWQTTQPVSIASMPSTPVTGTFWQATQPVSLSSTTITGSVAVTGPLTDTQLRATAVPVSIASMPSTPVTGTFYQATQPVSLASVPTHGVTGTFWQTTQPVSLASVPSHAVTLTSTTLTSVVPGVGATNLGKQTDSAAGATDTGVAVLAIRADTLATLTPIVGDYTRFRVNSVGRLWASATIDAALPAGTNAIGSITNTSFDATQSGTWNIGSITTMPTTPVTGTFWQTTQPVSLASVPTHGVTGTFWQATQPVSLASVPTHAVTQSGSWTVTTTANDTHDAAAGTTGQMSVGYASSTAQTAVAAGDAARFWTTLNGALNIADGGGNISIDDGGNSITVDGTFWQATQPVSGTFWQTTQPVSLASVPTHGVTGTFWQTTQPVSLASVPTHAVTQSGTWTVTTAAADTHDLAAGTIGQMSVGYASSTAPVAVAAGDAARIWTTLNGALNIADGGSTISIDDGAGSITVDGTFWQTTQPVSIASMPSTPVTGTFWQTTQPVSLASVPTHGVTGTFWQTTQPVSLASVPTHAVTQSGAWTVTTTANDTHDGAAGTNGQMQVGYAYGVAAADNTLPAISANADAARMLVNKNGAMVAVHLPEATQAYAPTNATTTAYAASIIAKATAGTLYMITGYNSGPDQFIQIHDSATLPANAAVPKVIFLVPAASNFSYDLGNYGRYFAAGITICNSTTGPTKTIGAANCWIDVQYK